MSVKVHTLSLPSPRGSTATHLLATRQSAVAMGVGSYRYKIGVFGLQRLRRLDGVVVRDRALHVVRDVRAAMRWCRKSNTAPYGRSMVRNAPLMYDHSDASRWGTSVSVCCSHVYSTSHTFTNMYGPRYSAEHAGEARAGGPPAVDPP